MVASTSNDGFNFDTTMKSVRCRFISLNTVGAITSLHVVEIPEVAPRYLEVLFFQCVRGFKHLILTVVVQLGLSAIDV